MSTLEHRAAPRTVDVLPTRARRRLTRRDGVLPVLLAIELAVGVAFGLAGAAGGSAAPSVPASLVSSVPAGQP